MGAAVRMNCHCSAYRRSIVSAHKTDGGHTAQPRAPALRPSVWRGENPVAQ